MKVMIDATNEGLSQFLLAEWLRRREHCLCQHHVMLYMVSVCMMNSVTCVMICVKFRANTITSVNSTGPTHCFTTNMDSRYLLAGAGAQAQVIKQNAEWKRNKSVGQLDSLYCNAKDWATYLGRVERNCLASKQRGRGRYERNQCTSLQPAASSRSQDDRGAAEACESQTGGHCLTFSIYQESVEDLRQLSA